MTSSKRVMLASEVDLEALRYPVLASPKLDGVRAVVWDGVLLSRSVRPIPNLHVQGMFGRSCFDGLDGELILAGRETDPRAFHETSGAVRRTTGEPDVIFHVFDILPEFMGKGVDRYVPFLQRLALVGDICRQLGNGVVRQVPHVCINSWKELEEYEAETVAAGYEGVMLRKPNGYYKHGRATVKEGLLLKLKRFEDDEGIIVDWIEEQHNGNAAKVNALGHTERSGHKANKTGKGTLGAFVVVKPGVKWQNGLGKDISRNDHVFHVGTGYTAAQRREFWEKREQMKGKLLKFRYQKYGTVDKPRIPVFVGIREAWDR